MGIWVLDAWRVRPREVIRIARGHHNTRKQSSPLHDRKSPNMRFTLFALVGAVATSPLVNARSEYDRPDLRGSYWDVSISTQSGRPGYSIRDFSASFHTPVSAQAFEGKCHYSFVPQGTGRPAETDECSGGLKYEWDCKSILQLPISWI